MSRIVVKDRWIVNDDTKRIRRAILDFIDEQGMKIEHDQDDEIEAYQGSQLRTRLLGGWFINARHLPKKLFVRLSKAEEGIKVQARMEESLGFGIMDPALESKYKSFFEEMLADLERAVS